MNKLTEKPNTLPLLHMHAKGNNMPGACYCDCSLVYGYALLLQWYAHNK